MEKQPSPATKRKHASANNLTVTRPGQEALSVELAARSGDYLQTLYALRQKQATVFDACRNSRDKAVMAKALADVLSLIEAEERAQRGQSGQSASNDEAAAERVRQSLTQAATFVQEVPDELL
jgi:selenocysteine-specific translation elongation factor